MLCYKTRNIERDRGGFLLGARRGLGDLGDGRIDGRKSTEGAGRGGAENVWTELSVVQCVRHAGHKRVKITRYDERRVYISKQNGEERRTVKSAMESRGSSSGVWWVRGVHG